MMVAGYYKNQIPPPRIEYRYIPKNFTEEQYQQMPIMSAYGQLFTKADPWSTSIGYPATFFRRKEEF